MPMPHDYNRASSTEDIYLYTENEPTETYWGDVAVSEYSGISNVEIDDGIIHVRLKGYNLYEQYKAPLMHEKRVTHYGSHNNSAMHIIGTVLWGGLPLMFNPKTWYENLNGWNEENEVHPKPDTRHSVKTGKTEWRAFDKPKNITIEYSKFKKELNTYTDNSDYDFNFQEEIYNGQLSTTKPVLFKVICSKCSDKNSQTQLDKLFSRVEVKKDLSLFKEKIIFSKKLEAEAVKRREKESQELAKLQMEQNDPLNPAKKQCKELGFKETTTKFADCVVKLSSSGLVNPSTPSSIVGGDSPEDRTCQKYGFKPGASDYSDCRMKIDMAKQQAAQQQEQFQQEQQQYQAELKAYEDRRRSNALMQFGLSLMANGGRTYTAPAPVAPTFDSSPRTYFLPGGRQMTCTTTGAFTDCF